MSYIRIPRGWEIPEKDVTDESVYLDRRNFLKAMGYSGIGLAALLSGCNDFLPFDRSEKPKTKIGNYTTANPNLYPAARNDAYTVRRALTQEETAATYNNFYEFSTSKDDVWELVDRFETRPWEVEISGYVKRKGVYDMDRLERLFPLEERIYRFRCVEAWAMTVPWTGFPFKTLIDYVEPSSSAKYVKMVTFLKPEEAPRQKRKRLPWPYVEGLSIDEAYNELAMLVTGIYGHPLPKQHGAPIRLIVPWKYGYKSIKSIVKIEFVKERPRNFWNIMVPSEYDFTANVNPRVPHPRWSQATERIIGSWKRLKTRPFNGYGEYVAHLYK